MLLLLFLSLFTSKTGSTPLFCRGLWPQQFASSVALTFWTFRSFYKAQFLGYFWGFSPSLYYLVSLLTGREGSLLTGILATRSCKNCFLRFTIIPVYNPPA